MKALGKKIWDFYLNGFPKEYAHDTYDRTVAYWPDDYSARGAYSLLEDYKEYDLKEFGTLWDCVKDVTITFEDAYLAWKGIEKPESISFEQWYSRHYAFYTHLMKPDMEAAWNAAIASAENSLQSFIAWKISRNKNDVNGVRQMNDYDLRIDETINSLQILINSAKSVIQATGNE